MSTISTRGVGPLSLVASNEKEEGNRYVADYTIIIPQSMTKTG